MPRVLSVYLPLWPTDRIARRLRRRRDEGRDRGRRAVLVVCRVSQREVVAHACALALRAGVTAGMALSHARALLNGGRGGEGAGPIVVPHQPRRDAAALLALARWATRWSPVVAVDGADGLLVNIAGCEHLFGGERALATIVQGKMAELGLTARVGVASTVGAAWALARHGPGGVGGGTVSIAPPGGERAALLPMPVAALRVGAATVEALGEVGVTRVGEVLNLPRAMLPARYGAELLRRIDQALGAAFEHVVGVSEPAPMRVSMELPGGTVAWESVAAAARHLLTRLAGLLEEREAGLRRLDAHFDRIDPAPLARRATLTVQTARPVRSREHLWSLLRPKLEGLNLGHGVEVVTMEAGGVGVVRHRQGGLPGGLNGGAGGAGGEGAEGATDAREDADAAVDLAIDTLANRLGAERVRRVVLRASHRPERAAETVAAFDHAGEKPARSEVRRAGPVPALGPAPGPERPSVLIDPPEPARVMALSPDGPVMAVSWRGRDARVVSCAGPERISGEWWRGREPARDYFRAQEESGRWLWLFREAGGGGAGGAAAWFVHGEWA
jgi:protein ImuB